MSALVWVALFVGVPVVLFVIGGTYLAGVLKWEDDQTVGLAYYGRSLVDREAFKRRLERHAARLAPILWLNAKIARFDFRKARIQFRGLSAPAGSCSPASFAKAVDYRPRAEDIFVGTQMKCGTTWMQQVVYEVLNRGNGTLVASGTALYAIAPWLEGRKSVPIEEAPTVGAERPGRIIKTHLPAELCPADPAARFIYVARHPVACFASCVDFVVTNVGPLAPNLAAFEEWFCAPDLMWWGTWPDHVRGWWERSTRDDNVLFVYFEDMVKDLPGVIRRVAAFLGVAPLGPAELARVVEKCEFRYMREHQTSFEMHPPHLFQTNAKLFVAGTASRDVGVPDDIRRRMLRWCAREMAGSDFPLSTAYPDVAAAAS